MYKVAGIKFSQQNVATMPALADDDEEEKPLTGPRVTDDDGPIDEEELDDDLRDDDFSADELDELFGLLDDEGELLTELDDDDKDEKLLNDELEKKLLDELRDERPRELGKNEGDALLALVEELLLGDELAETTLPRLEDGITAPLLGGGTIGDD